MSIKKEENGTWTVQCYYIDWMGNRKRKKKRGFKKKGEASKWERDFMSKVSPIDLTIKEFIDVYFEDKKNELKDRTISSKKHMMKKHLIPYFGDKQINSIIAADIIKWQNTIIEKNFSDAYLRGLQNQLTALFTHASKIYDLHDNPCKKVSKMGNYETSSMTFWTKEEYEQFREQLKIGSQYYVLFETLFWTGMREGEMLALTKSDIDLVAMQIHITKTYYRKDRQDVITSPKTKQSIRTIDIPEFLRDELSGYMNRIYGLQDNDRIFPVVAEAVQHKLKREVEKGNLKKIRVHDFRHSHVAYLINQGVQVLVIKERVGHKDIGITLNIYGHLYPSEQKQVAAMLNERYEVKE